MRLRISILFYADSDLALFRLSVSYYTRGNGGWGSNPKRKKEKKKKNVNELDLPLSSYESKCWKSFVKCPEILCINLTQAWIDCYYSRSHLCQKSCKSVRSRRKWNPSQTRGEGSITDWILSSPPPLLRLFTTVFADHCKKTIVKYWNLK